jgi:hypothetical protein
MPNPPDADDYRYWLQWAGAELNGDDPRDWVREHGLPEPLRELLRGLSRQP